MLWGVSAKGLAMDDRGQWPMIAKRKLISCEFVKRIRATLDDAINPLTYPSLNDEAHEVLGDINSILHELDYWLANTD